MFVKIEKNKVDEVWGIIKILGRHLTTHNFFLNRKRQSILQKWLKLGFPVKYAKTGQYTFSRLNKMRNNLY